MPNLLSAGPWIVEAAAYRARVLERLAGQSPNYFDLSSLIRDDGNPIVEQQLERTPRGLNLWYYIALCGRNLFVFIDGIRTEPEARLIYDSYQPGWAQLDFTPPPRASGLPGFVENTLYFAQANYVWQRIRQFGPHDHIFLCGWSAGGAVAFYVPRYFQTIRTYRPEISICTFGAPRASGSRMMDTYVANITRWMNADDAVCIVPPKIQADLAVWGGGHLTAQQVAHYRQYGHSRGGLQIRQDLTIEASVTPTEVVNPPQRAIRAWLLEARQAVPNGHSIATYRGRLEGAHALAAQERRAAQEQYEPDTGVGGGGGGGDDVEPVRVVPGERFVPPPIAPLPRPVVQELQELAAEQVQAPVEIPNVNLFSAHNQAGIWMVYFGDTMVVTAVKRKHAQSLVRYGNAFLRRLQGSAVVHAETLAQTWVHYLALASNPESGFVPQLNTMLPR